MRDWCKGQRGGLLVLTVVALLVAGGLGWVTQAALRIEREQLVARAEVEHAGRLRLALWRLDSYVGPLLTHEDGRPFDHYSALFVPTMLLDNDAHPFTPGSVVQPSPLLYVDLPEWMSLHFQVDSVGGWQSPQVPSQELREKLSHEEHTIPMANASAAREQLLDRLCVALPYHELQAGLQARKTNDRVVHARAIVPPRPLEFPNIAYLTEQSKALLQQDFQQRSEQIGRQAGNPRLQRLNRDVANSIAVGNGENWLGRGPALVSVGSEVSVKLGRLSPLWLRGQDDRDHLLAVRLVKIDDTPADRVLCQGVVLDLEGLRKELLPQVHDLFPEAKLVPAAPVVGEVPPGRMTALPLHLDPGAPPEVPDPGWTTLRTGLALAWVAALFALFAVGLGGWTLIDLSERRARFVSAVTHELRTPLTTLRLYLEMLLDGMVRDEQTRQEYLATLHAEAERLTRLVDNVLDYSRLEKARPNLVLRPTTVGELLGQVEATWVPRCATTGKQLLVETLLPAGTALTTDVELVQQIISNLIDNACKYSRGADDTRLWVRARAEAGRIVVEVEDRGPGVPATERRSIFSPFQRGGNADPSTGGVGLGLALARRWAELLGGTLELCPASSEGGACFRLILPA